MSTTIPDDTRVKAWRETVAALAAFADWLEREAVPSRLVEDVPAWEAFLRRVWPVLASVWPARSQVRQVCRRRFRMVGEHPDARYMPDPVLQVLPFAIVNPLTMQTLPSPVLNMKPLLFPTCSQSMTVFAGPSAELKNSFLPP